jgi:asparagine synthase (glutamine-hydrolysing)
LPPAHKLEFREETVQVTRYWELPQINKSIKKSEAILKFSQLLDTSVKNQLVADVPVGAFLSGGLDSTTIVALASKYKKNLKTFAFEFEGSESELSFAREVAKKYGTDHTELKDSDYDIASLLKEMSSIYDEPFADSSNIPTYVMSKVARKYAKVILTGDGGDEMCGGYAGWYQPLLVYGFSKPFKMACHFIFKFLKFARFPFMYKLRQIDRGITLEKRFSSPEDAHEAHQQYFTSAELAHLGFTAPYRKRDFLSSKNNFSRRYDVAHNAICATPVDDAIRMDIEDYMPGDILVKIDRASMAHGLELRAPFLDRDFAEFCISLPSSFKISLTSDKKILRESFASLWPQSIKKRSKKGFGAPVHTWLLMPDVQKLKKTYLDDPKLKIFEIISFEKSRSYVSRNDYKTWILLVLSLWLEDHNYPIE